MACPGSINLSRQVPVPPQTDFALEGTRAHALAELALRKGVDADFFLGMKLEGGEVTEDMAAFVQVFIDVCRNYSSDPATKTWVEQRFNLGSLNPPGPMFGTADFVAYDEIGQELIVIDLKYGQGVVVEAIGNKQLRYYALGAALSDEVRQLPIRTVRMGIVQPRVTHPDGVVRWDTIEYDELIGFAGDLLIAARATTAPDAPLNPGAHCRFCPASGVCPAQASRALEVAQQEFDVVVSDGAVVSLPSPDVLTKDQLVAIMQRLPVLEDWAGAIRATAEAMLRRGEEVPGYKMVAKRAIRKWGSEEDAVAAAQAADLGPDEYYKEPELKSPAQLEKVMGKKTFAAKMAPHVVKVSSGHVMVPDTDARPAVALSAGDEFAGLLESGE
jgi:hypothetical protein